jgi:hypothetical protein
VMRHLYALLISLHPSSFRKRFAQEMSLIFDEADNSWGAGSLFRDAILSLLRQWLIRSDLWKWLIAGIGAVVLLIIAFGSFLPWDRPVHL